MSLIQGAPRKRVESNVMTKHRDPHHGPTRDERAQILDRRQATINAGLQTDAILYATMGVTKPDTEIINNIAERMGTWWQENGPQRVTQPTSKNEMDRVAEMMRQYLHAHDSVTPQGFLNSPAPPPWMKPAAEAYIKVKRTIEEIKNPFGYTIGHAHNMKETFDSFRVAQMHTAIMDLTALSWEHARAQGNPITLMQAFEGVREQFSLNPDSFDGWGRTRDGIITPIKELTELYGKGHWWGGEDMRERLANERGRNAGGTNNPRIGAPSGGKMLPPHVDYSGDNFPLAVSRGQETSTPEPSIRADPSPQVNPEARTREASPDRSQYTQESAEETRAREVDFQRRVAERKAKRSSNKNNDPNER